MAGRACGEALLLLLLPPLLTALLDAELPGSGDESERAEPGEAGPAGAPLHLVVRLWRGRCCSPRPDPISSEPLLLARAAGPAGPFPWGSRPRPGAAHSCGLWERLSEILLVFCDAACN